MLHRISSGTGPSRRFQRLTISVAIGALRTWLDLQLAPHSRDVTHSCHGRYDAAIHCTECYNPPLKGRITMRRREFIALMGASVAWPFAALAQQAGRTYRIGGLSGVSTQFATYLSRCSMNFGD